MTEQGTHMPDREQLDKLARYFDEEVSFSRHIGAKVDEVEPGRAVISINIEDVHLNGAGTLPRRGLRLAHRQLHGYRRARAGRRPDGHHRDECPFPGRGKRGPYNLPGRGRPPHPPDSDRRGQSLRRGRKPGSHGHRRVPGLREKRQRHRVKLLGASTLSWRFWEKAETDPQVQESELPEILKSTCEVSR